MWVGYPNAQIEMRTEYHGGPVAGGTFPAEIWHDYMTKVKGKFCGDFKPPKKPFHATPFFGKYSRSGGKGTGEDDQQTAARSSTRRRRRPRPRRRRPDTEQEAGQRQRQRQRQGQVQPGSLRVAPAGRAQTPGNNGGGNGQDGGTAAPTG